MTWLGPVAGTTPYPWPYDGGCPGERLALVLAGWDPWWRAAVPASAAAHATEAGAADLAAAIAAAGGGVLAVDHAPPPRAGTGARRSIAGPPDPPSATVHRAAGVDGFYGSGLDASLRARGVTHLLVAGHGLEGPVHSTLRSANDRGYECLLVLDAASSLGPGLTGPARSMVEMSGGIFGAVGTIAKVLAALGLVTTTRSSA